MTEKLVKNSVVVITSGYFNPIHRGHVECINLSKKLFPKTHLVVIVNNDKQVMLKKGYTFIPMEDRVSIVENLRVVDEVFRSVDEDASVIRSIEALAKKYSGYRIVFAKGGDRNIGNIPEREVCEKYNIEIISGVGDKIESSSALMKNMDDYVQRVLAQKRS